MVRMTCWKRARKLSRVAEGIKGGPNPVVSISTWNRCRSGTASVFDGMTALE